LKQSTQGGSLPIFGQKTIVLNACHHINNGETPYFYDDFPVQKNNLHRVFLLEWGSAPSPAATAGINPASASFGMGLCPKPRRYSGNKSRFRFLRNGALPQTPPANT